MTGIDEEEKANEIATVRIELVDSDPLIWREVEVPTSTTLEGLHDIVQAAIGWENSHLWEFKIDKRRYGIPMDEDGGAEPPVDAGEVYLRDVLRPRKTIITYLYDFGDDWEHGLTVTKVRAGEPGLAYPRYVAGERNGPPEDSGGIPGFYSLLATAADPKHPEHAEIKAWLGRYDPENVNEAAIKKRLKPIATRLSAPKSRAAKPKSAPKA